MLSLYHHGSSACAAKVRLALQEKQLLWSSHYIDILAGEQFRPEFLALNPKGVVPVLVHDDAIVTESTIICEYVEEAFPENPIYPRPALERARVREWTKAVDEELHPACSALTYIVSHRHTILRQGVEKFEEFVHRGGAEGASARALKWQWVQHGLEAPGAADKIRLYDSYLRKMEQVLGVQSWLVGDKFSMADIAMAPYVNRLDALSMAGLWRGGRLPMVEAWFDRLRARSSFVSALGEWTPTQLVAEMRENGIKSWPAIARIVGL